QGMPVRTLAAASPPALDQWLERHSAVAKAVIWDFGKDALPYAAWPESSKAQLRAAYLRAWHGEPSGLPDPPPNRLARQDDNRHLTVLSDANAFALHAALVGNSLAAEIGTRLPWSIAGYSEPALAALLDGRQTFARSSTLPDGYATVLHGVPAPPEAALD